MRKLYIVAYDVAHPKRLKAMLQLLKIYSSGCQKSVFECFLTEFEKTELLQSADDILNPEEDRLLLIPLRKDAQIVPMGKAVLPKQQGLLYIG